MRSSSLLDGFLTATPMKAPPDEVKLSREEGQALIERLQANTLTGEDRGLLVKLIQLYFWFTFALRETKISRVLPAALRDALWFS